MSKIADYLREHIIGEVSANSAVRERFSTDGSIFEITPQVVVYPRVIDDVRKIARFSWQLAERKKTVPITPRGAGNSQTGAAIGEGVILAFPAHMNKLLELDTKKNYVSVQPGINYRVLQDTIKTHGRFIPPFPGSADCATIGGAIGSNSAGLRSVKYGTTSQYVNSLKVVLSNGELIETGRVSKRELNRKKGLATFEGEIYRQLDGLIVDNWDLIQTIPRNTAQNSSGYALADVKQKDGSFDLTPLLTGSEGTLGIIVQAELSIAPNNMDRTLVVAGFENIDQITAALPDITKLEPATLEMLSGGALDWIEDNYPHHLAGLVDKPFPGALLLVEFDDLGRSTQSKKAKKLTRILRKITEDFQVADDYDEREELWKIRESVALLAAHGEGSAQALPIINDGVVPVGQLSEFYTGLMALLKKHELDPVIWGSIGDGRLSTLPLIGMDTVGGRQKIFKLKDAHAQLVTRLGGSVAASQGDGRLNTPYMSALYGEEVFKLLQATKKVFDPHAILNPGVKFGTQRADQLQSLRQSYQPSIPAHFIALD